METALLIYLYITVGKALVTVSHFLWVGLVIYALALCTMGLSSNFGTDRYEFVSDDLTSESEIYLSLRKHLKNAVVTFGVLVLCNSLYPDKEELAWIIGGAAAVSVATTEEAKKLPDNVLRAANTFLEGVAEKGKGQEAAQ